MKKYRQHLFGDEVSNIKTKNMTYERKINK